MRYATKVMFRAVMATELREDPIKEWVGGDTFSSVLRMVRKHCHDEVRSPHYEELFYA